MSMEESISLEETNKIRISLGLKPLADDGEPADPAEKQAQQNYAQQREQESKQRESKKLKDRIAKVRNRQELNAGLKGATLGDADGTTDNTLHWLKKSKKREKELAKKRLKELEELDSMAQEEYTERDLAGLKVTHDFDAMEDGEAHVLTLKDSRIIDNEEDELQNIEMAESEKTAKNQELKIKKADYTGYDDEEFTPGHLGVKPSVLSKYDKVLNGEEETGFRLGSSSATQSRATKKAKEQQDAAASVNKSLLSIDYKKSLLTEDYIKEGEVGFKKPKTKKKRSSRRAAVADPDPDDSIMDVDTKPVARERNLDANFVDDDDLQAALARSRKAKIHKHKKLNPEELAKKVAHEREEAENARTKVENESPAVVGDGEGEGEGGGLTFDDTSEFIRAVGTEPVLVKREVKVKAEPQPSQQQPQPPTRDVSMAPGDVVMTELEAGELDIKEEEEEEFENAEEAMALLDSIEAVLKSEDHDKATEEGEEEMGVGGTASQPTFGGGMASTLNVLRQQGILSTPSTDQKDREKTQLQRDLWLADQRRRVAQRELERLQSRGQNKDQATREYENRLREQQDARGQLETFKNYKPDVNIVYYDEYGRSLTPKEAWKALSHKFHGKGSGKAKTEKKLKKIEEEKRREAMASGDTPLSMQRAFQIRQEKTGQAHFVLSVGNRGAVPQAEQFLDPRSLSKAKYDKKGKKKDGKKVHGGELESSGGGFMTVPAPLGALGSTPLDDGVLLGGGGSGNGSPAPRAGFSRIGGSSAVVAAATVEGAPSGTGTPLGGEQQHKKVVFGFGAKRKAEDDLAGTPPLKR